MTRKPLLLGVICNVTPYPMSKSCMIEKLVSWCTRDRLWRDIGGLRPSVGSGAYGCALARSRADIWRPCICNHHGYWNSNCSHLIRNKKYWFEAIITSKRNPLFTLTLQVFTSAWRQFRICAFVDIFAGPSVCREYEAFGTSTAVGPRLVHTLEGIKPG